MSNKFRTKEIWHVPKRGNVHQTIYMVYLLSTNRFVNKSWSSGKQEILGSEMGKAGLTESGKAISHQSVRTLLANVPKYFGFVYLDETSHPAKLTVTDVGYQLLKEHNITQYQQFKKLSEYKNNGKFIETSKIFQQQMLKLIITNPSIRYDCEKILVFPFRMTLKILLELKYLDKEEIGYILFNTKSEDELSLVIERIKNFRNLPKSNRTLEIEAYKKTAEGQLTIVLAPTANYYMYLCYSSGLCQRIFVNVNKDKEAKLAAIKLTNEDKVHTILKRYQDIKIYDFKDNSSLWKEYFSNPKRLHPPHDVVAETNSNNDILVTIFKGGDYIAGDVISENNTNLIFPVFHSENYQIFGFDLESGKEIYGSTIKFNLATSNIKIDTKLTKSNKFITGSEILEQIKQLLGNKYKGVDKSYYSRLITIQKVIGKNYFDNRRVGGRLEYLFYQLLYWAKTLDKIDEVFWYGYFSQYGICEPAPGGKVGNPDITFEIDNYQFVLELTKFIGNRAQWNSAEASSVPDHITKFKKQNSEKSTIGIFCAPSIHTQLQKNLMLNAKHEGVGMIFISCIQFARMIIDLDKNALLNTLVSESIKQL